MQFIQGKELTDFMESQNNKMKTNIKMRVTHEQSRKVQEICFDNNIGWGFEGKYKDIQHLEKPLLFIYDKNITFSYYDNAYFVNHENKEIDAYLFIRTNGTCEEPIGSKFQPSDEVIRLVSKLNGWDKLETRHYTMNMLLDKLKKKNEILKKARIKRKNKREELHKLNLKLQKCISLEAHNKKIESIEFDLNMFKSSNKLRGDLIEKLEAENIEMGKFVNLNKSALDLAVMTKDLAIKTVEEQNKEIEKLKAIIEYLESKVK